MANETGQQQQQPVQGASGNAAPGQNPQQASQQQQQQQQQQQRPANKIPLADLNRIVLEYLNKKGYNKTEATLRIESSRSSVPPTLTNGTNGQHNNVANRPIAWQSLPGRQLNNDPKLYDRAYALLREWVENSLDLYQPELRRMCFPIFVHMFLDLVAKNEPTLAKQFFEEYSPDHDVLHGQDIEKLSGISLSSHLEENDLSKAFRRTKYQLRVSQTSFDLLLYFLQENESSGGSIAIRILNQYVEFKVTSARPSRYDSEYSIDPNEGLPGMAGGDQIEKFNSQTVKLGAMQVDTDFDKEITAALEQQDEQNKDNNSTGPTMVEQYNQIKQENSSDDGPTRDTLPLPQYKSVDVRMAIRNVAETKNRIKIGVTGASLPSVCMYTFHNTHDGLNCLSFSDDSELVAGGFSDSFVKIWSLKGEKLSSALKNDEPSSSKRLVGHAGSVFGTSFSPDNRYLLSCSEDKTVRLWSMDTYTALVSYKGHNHPVWDVAFGPYGHYFATASHDQTARLWSCDHIYPLRIFAGHVSDVDTVTFHPNGTYVITGSSDKTCRMWDINKGNSVRVFHGHTQAVTATAVSPDGRWLASACDDGQIIVWDIGSARRLKIMRGHGRTTIYSLAFSRDGSVLVSAGADNSVRVWDIKKGTSDSVSQPEPFPTSDSANGSSTAGTNGSVSANSANPSTDAKGNDAEKRKKEIVATYDHMAAFYTKKTPVYKVHFTQRNLCLAGGAFTG